MIETYYESCVTAWEVHWRNYQIDRDYECSHFVYACPDSLVALKPSISDASRKPAHIWSYGHPGMSLPGPHRPLLPNRGASVLADQQTPNADGLF